jgi:hypothetical protein
MTSGSLNPLVLSPRSFPLVRPQITCLDDDIYFGSFPVTRVTPIESGFLKACTGERTLADAARAADADAMCVARVASWLLWWRRPLGAEPQPSKPIDRLVFSASHTGAWLGMGARLVMEALRRRTLVVGCFGSLGETRFRDAFPTLAEVSMSGRDEAAFVAKLAGVQQEVWDFPDHVLRDALPAGRDLGAALGEILRTTLLDLIEKTQPSEIFAPAALGHSTDQRLLFDTLLALYADGSIQGELHFYEDEPVIAGHRRIDEFLSRFEGSYLVPREYYVDVTESFPEKLSIVDAFRCNLDRRNARAWVRSGEREGLLAGTGRAERFWRLEVACVE